jgi:hypothetical protein
MLITVGLVSVAESPLSSSNNHRVSICEIRHGTCGHIGRNIAEQLSPSLGAYADFFDPQLISLHILIARPLPNRRRRDQRKRRGKHHSESQG